MDFKLKTKDLDEVCHTGKGRHEEMREKEKKQSVVGRQREERGKLLIL